MTNVIIRNEYYNSKPGRMVGEDPSVSLGGGEEGDTDKGAGSTTGAAG